MKEICTFLSGNFSIYHRAGSKEIISISLYKLEKIKVLIDYFNKYPLLGVKGENFKD
jgi:hypothetical protein